VPGQAVKLVLKAMADVVTMDANNLLVRYEDNRKIRMDTMLEKDSARFNLANFYACLDEMLSFASESFKLLLPSSRFVTSIVNAIQRGSELIETKTNSHDSLKKVSLLLTSTTFFICCCSVVVAEVS
jgi:hypothetical protein